VCVHKLDLFRYFIVVRDKWSAGENPGLNLAMRAIAKAWYVRRGEVLHIWNLVAALEELDIGRRVKVGVDVHDRNLGVGTG
jgi:hypothetical protein